MDQQATMNNSLKFKDDGVKLVRIVSDQVKSRTQSVKTLIIEKDGQLYVSMQKWWRKSAELPWEESKGFHFEPREAMLAIHDLQMAVNSL